LLKHFGFEPFHLRLLLFLSLDRALGLFEDGAILGAVLQTVAAALWARVREASTAVGRGNRVYRSPQLVRACQISVFSRQAAEFALTLAYEVACCGGEPLNGEPRPAMPREAEAREAEQHHRPGRLMAQSSQ
jgi:hypothetical protein